LGGGARAVLLCSRKAQYSVVEVRLWAAGATMLEAGTACAAAGTPVSRPPSLSLAGTAAIAEQGFTSKTNDTTPLNPSSTNNHRVRSCHYQPPCRATADTTYMEHSVPILASAVFLAKRGALSHLGPPKKKHTNTSLHGFFVGVKGTPAKRAMVDQLSILTRVRLHRPATLGAMDRGNKCCYLGSNFPPNFND